MDADEVFHEADYDRIKKIPESVGEGVQAIRFNTLHFYKDYYHLLNNSTGWKDMYTSKVYMVRNGLGIHHGNSGTDIDAHLDRYGIPIKEDSIVHLTPSVFHYGHVRSDYAYLNKQNRMHTYYEGKPIKNESVVWIPEDKLTTFSGKHPDVMKKRVGIGTADHKKILELYR
jgi:hypothetical protein